MPRIPKYRLHKPTGQALVEMAGQRLYLGKHGTPESRERYERLLAEYLANGRRVPDWALLRERRESGASALLIVNLLARYLEHAEGYYVHPDGRPTSAQSDIVATMRPLRRLYGHTAAAEFGPKKLLLVREEMVRMGWNRATVNDRVKWVRRIFRWGAEHEIVPAAAWQALSAVQGLRAGRSRAPEPRKVKPVARERVEAVQPFVSRQVWAMIQLQLLTGARGGEICRMRPIDLDMSGEVWQYKPDRHKTAYRGHDRVIFLGPQAQEVVRPFLSNRPINAYLFSPQEAEAERMAELHATRKTPLSCGTKPKGQRWRNASRPPKAHYSPQSYARAIQRACDLAFPAPHDLERKVTRSKRLRAKKRWERDDEHVERVGQEGVEALRGWRREHRWHPHQLRHTAATELRARYGIEAARVMLGHGAPTITETYAERDMAAAARIAREVG